VAHVYRIIHEFVTEDPIAEKELESNAKEAGAYLSGVLLPEVDFEYDKDSVVVHAHKHVLRDGYCRIDYELCQKEVLDPDEDCL
jgi:hypothetical protein